jgi:pimeloyl-ACP methyl ester carboxylesterase
MSSMTNGGQQLNYVDHGGDGPVVLMLHAFLMDTGMFAPQVAALGGDFRLIAMDERGHGGSPTDATFDYWDVARDALALLDHLGIERAAIIGTSQGGFVAMRAALLAPGRVTALAVLGTSAAVEDPDVATAYRGFADLWEAQGPVDALLDVNAAICLGETDATDWKAKWRDIPAARLKNNLETLVGRDDLLGRLGEIKAPILVLHGSKDAAYPVARAEEIVAGAPNAEPLVVVEGGAHFLSLTDAVRVNPHLGEFLGKRA